MVVIVIVAEGPSWMNLLGRAPAWARDRGRARLSTGRFSWPGHPVQVAPMMQLEVFGESALMARVVESLTERDGVSRVRCVDAAHAGHAVVTAGVRPRSVDPMLDDLRRLGVQASDTLLTRVEVVDWAASRHPEESLVWADVLGQAWLNARPVARYLALMVIAGVIASYGVTEANTILIVGAMAVSPDLLPITAIGVGILGRRRRLTVEASLTLIVGLGVAAGAAAVSAAVQDGFDLIPSGFSLDSASVTLGGLTTVSHETVVVAFVAGVAGMLALETRASSAVGVAVSVTTIPAAAYLGRRGRGRRAVDGHEHLRLARGERGHDGGGRRDDALAPARAEAAPFRSPRGGQLIARPMSPTRSRRTTSPGSRMRRNPPKPGGSPLSLARRQASGDRNTVVA